MKRILIALVLTCSGSFALGAGLTLPDYETLKLDNGATLLLMRKPDVPLVAAQIIVRGGSLADASGKEGTAALLAELMTKGAGQRDALGFAQALDGVGGTLEVAATREGLVASAEFLARDADLMLELLADALQRPTLDGAEFEKAAHPFDPVAGHRQGRRSALADRNLRPVLAVPRPPLRTPQRGRRTQPRGVGPGGYQGLLP
jgi:hypothetical protein